MSEMVAWKNDLPNGWIEHKLEDCVEILDSKRIPINANERKQRQGNIPYFGSTGQVGWINDYLFNEELVLLGEDAAPFLDIFRNKAYLISGKSWVNNHAHVLKTINNLLSNRFLCYFLNQFDYHEYVTGTTRLKLNQKSMRMISILLPPLNEQKRIVSKIESIFAQIDATKKQLEMLVSQTKFTPGSLNMLKNNILKHAFEGKLVPQNYHDESIEKSLLKIRQERQRIWRKELLSKGKELKKFTYVESELIYTNAFELPQGWKSVKIQDVVITPKQDIVDGPFGSNLKSSEYVDHGIPIIRIQNIDRNHFINKNIHYVTKEKSEQLNRHSFSKNDVVITKLGIPVGKACLVPEYLENGIIVADILRMRVVDEFVSRKFLMYMINSEIIVKQFTHHTSGTTRPRVNLTKFRNFDISLPPLNEQKRIVSKIESIFGNIDTLNLFYFILLRNLFTNLRSFMILYMLHVIAK